MVTLDLSKPRQKELQVDIGGAKPLVFTLRRIKIKDAKEHAEQIEKLNKVLTSGELDGLSYSLQMLELKCEPWGESQNLALQDLDEDQLAAIWKKVRELKETPDTPEESAEKKT